jgi:hypothetical protein
VNGRINTFMKDCVWFRAILYFSIASIPTLIAELSKYKTFDEITPIAKTIILANVIFQGIIAVRAFVDQSISRVTSDKKPSKSVELLKETTK